MNSTSLLQFLGAAACLTFASCESVHPYKESDPAKRQGSGYSLDNAPTGQSRYMPGATSTANRTTTTEKRETTTTTTPSVDTPAGPDATSTTTTTTTTTTTPPDGPGATVSPPPAPTTPSAPSYGSPVPGRRGFVYPPGVESKPENMVDVRDFTPGQKVRDPRTGKIFLVP